MPPITMPSTVMGTPPLRLISLPDVAIASFTSTSADMPPVGARLDTADIALRVAESVLRNLAPSMRRKARRLPPSSTTAMHCGTPMAAAFATAASMIIKAPSWVRRKCCFTAVLLIWLSPIDVTRSFPRLEQRGNSGIDVDQLPGWQRRVAAGSGLRQCQRRQRLGETHGGADAVDDRDRRPVLELPPESGEGGAADDDGIGTRLRKLGDRRQNRLRRVGWRQESVRRQIDRL